MRVDMSETNQKTKMAKFIKMFVFTISFSWDDFKLKYSGAVMGYLWAFIQPLITILLYWFIFQLVLHNGAVDGIPFIIWLISGILPWFFIGDSIPMSVATLREYSYLIKKVKFNTYILPLIKPISALFVHIFLMLASFVIFLLYGNYPKLRWLMLLYYMIYVIVLLIGISYIVSTLYVFFKDIAQIVAVLIQLLFWMTPIVWNIRQIEDIPRLKFIITLSPFYYIVNGYRTILIGGGMPHLGIQDILYWLFPISILGVGLVVFKASRKHFADIL